MLFGKIFKSINDQKLYYLTIGLKSSYVSLLIHLLMRGDQTAKMLWILLGLSWSIYNIAVKRKKSISLFKKLCSIRRKEVSGYYYTNFIRIKLPLKMEKMNDKTCVNSK